MKKALSDFCWVKITFLPQIHRFFKIKLVESNHFTKDVYQLALIEVKILEEIETKSRKMDYKKAQAIRFK